MFWRSGDVGGWSCDRIPVWSHFLLLLAVVNVLKILLLVRCYLMLCVGKTSFLSADSVYFDFVACYLSISMLAMSVIVDVRSGIRM